MSSFDKEQSQRARVRREQLQRARTDRAKRSAPPRFAALLAIAVAGTFAIRGVVAAFGWSHDTGTILVSAMVVVLCVVGLPVALAGGASSRSFLFPFGVESISGALGRLRDWWRKPEPGPGYSEPTPG